MWSLLCIATAAEAGMGQKHQDISEVHKLIPQNMEVPLLPKSSKNSNPSQILPALHNNLSFSASILSLNFLFPETPQLLFVSFLHYLMHYHLLYFPNVLIHFSS